MIVSPCSRGEARCPLLSQSASVPQSCMLIVVWMHIFLLKDYKTSKIKSNWGLVLRENTEQQQTQKPLAELPIIHQVLFVLSDRIAQKLEAYCFYPVPRRAEKCKRVPTGLVFLSANLEMLLLSILGGGG